MNKNFGSHVFRGADETEGSCLVFLHSLAGAHVDQFEVAIAAHHDVFRLEIAVDDALVVKYFQHVDE